MGYVNMNHQTQTVYTNYNETDRQGWGGGGV